MLPRPVDRELRQKLLDPMREAACCGGHKSTGSFVMDWMLDTDIVSNEELLERTRGGSWDSFGLMYERRRGLVLAFLMKRTGDAELAMDLMAETFAGALLGLKDDPPTVAGSAAPWRPSLASLGSQLRTVSSASKYQARIDIAGGIAGRSGMRRAGLEPAPPD